MARIVLVTYGSYGDVHPYLAVAIGLRSAGHDVTLATSEFYRSKVEGEGVGFHAIAPDIGLWELDEDFRRKAMHPTKGTQFVIEKMFVPYVEESYEELLALCRNADIIVSHTLAFAAPMVAEKWNIPWVLGVLQPTSFFSMYDPPIFPILPDLGRFLYRLRPYPQKLLFPVAAKASNRWIAAVFELRRKVGVRNYPVNPLTAPFSPFGNMAWFSKVLGTPQRDWPANTLQTGFPFYDQDQPGLRDLDAAMEKFLNAGEPPVVFTLGTSAALSPGTFFEDTLSALKRLDVRAVLVSPEAEKIPGNDRLFTARYAPYSKLFSRAAANVHQGGVGTTAQALRAGKPMLVVPFSHDQPDNAARVERLGVGRVLKRNRYRRGAIVSALGSLLRDAGAAKRAREVAATMQSENAIDASRVYIEALAGRR